MHLISSAGVLKLITMHNMKFVSNLQENVGGTTYFYNAEDFTPQREGIVSRLVLTCLKLSSRLMNYKNV